MSAYRSKYLQEKEQPELSSSAVIPPSKDATSVAAVDLKDGNILLLLTAALLYY